MNSLNQKRKSNRIYLSRVFLLTVSVLFLVSFLAGVVSAGQTQIEEKSNKLVQGIIALFKPIVFVLIGKEASAAAILAFFMMVIIFYGIMDSMGIIKVSNNILKNTLNFLLGVIISAIGVRFLPEGLLTAMSAPSSALVVVIFLGIPFIAFYFLLKEKPAYVQRLGWFMYGMIIIAIIIYNTFFTGNKDTMAAFKHFSWLYLVFAIGAFGMGWFGGHIQRFVEEGKEEFANIKGLKTKKSEIESRRNELIDRNRVGLSKEDRGLLDDEIKRLKLEMDRIDEEIKKRMSRGNKKSLKWILSFLVILAVLVFIVYVLVKAVFFS